MTETTPITDLAITLIEVDPRNSPRDGIDDARVEEFRSILDQLPPVLVYCTKPGRYTLAAGFHRLAAHQAEARDTIRAEVRIGTLRDARLAGMLSDLKAAKMLTVEERHRAIEAVAEIRADDSARVIADLCGCSEATVRRIRSGASFDAPEKVTGADGKSYPARKPPPDPTCPDCGDELDPDGTCRECEAAAEIEAARNRPVDPIPEPSDADVEILTDNAPARAPDPAARAEPPRQVRVAPAALAADHPCPHCGGTGRVRS